jgi:GST-like protein
MHPQLVLHGAPTGNCFRAAIALSEADLPYAIQRVQLRHGEHKQAEYLAVNPLGQVPALAIPGHDGPGNYITQSNAIMFYAAEATPAAGLLGKAPQERARVLERFFYFLTEVISPSHASFQLKNAFAPGAAQILDSRFLARLAYAEQFLLGQPYMAGDSFTLADIAAFTIAYAYREVLDWPSLPRLRAWYSHVAQRPSIQHGMSAFAN